MTLKKSNSTKKIGVYGGTFDPIHFGHLNLAIQLKEAHELEEVKFCPVRISPHKQHQQPTPIQYRLAMLRIALEGVPGCSITEVEVNRSGPSYTIDTLNDLMAEEQTSPQPRQLSLLLGDDAIPSFCRWHQPEAIAQLVPIYIGRRSLASLSDVEFPADPFLAETLKKGLTKTRMMEISSTEIRDRLHRGLYCGHLLPQKVLDFIYQQHLYFF